MNQLFRLAFTVLLALAAAGSAQAQSVGVTAAVNQSAHGTPPGGTMRTIVMGESIVHEERIATNSIGLVQLLFTDGTTLTVGPNSELVIESYLYDRNAGTAQLAASMSKGVLRFIGGLASKNADGATIDTPIGTIGIRGGIADINLNPPSGILPHVDMIFGKDVTLTRAGVLLERLYLSGYSIVVAAGGGVAVQKTPPGWSSQIQAALTGRPGTSGGASQQPTDQTVAESEVPDSNSQGTTPPTARGEPQPLTQTEVAELLAAVSTYDELRQFIVPAPPPNDQPPEEPQGTTYRGPASGLTLGYLVSDSGEISETQGLPLVTTGTTLSDATLTSIILGQNGLPIAGTIDLMATYECEGCHFVLTVDESGTTLTAYDDDEGARDIPNATGYIRDHSAVSLPAGVAYCECAFLHWGVAHVEAPVEGPAPDMTGEANGTWVVGTPTSAAELEILANVQELSGTMATYTGHAFGWTSNGDPAAALTAGSFAMTWSFAERWGVLDIGNFAGRDFHGEMGADGGGIGFQGPIAEGGEGSAYGVARGMFFNNGNAAGAGVAGDFSVVDDNWSGAGVFLGERGADTYPTD